MSLLMVSGYLGNPASSFGHSLLKLNHHGAADGGKLRDLSFNYGALVPPDESTVVYILRGLFGGYQAGFSDKLYYTHDQVYTRGEFRDIWEFELDLTRTEREMLVGHLWEIVGKKFRYFFLTKNCAFRMAELLSIARERTLEPAPHLWYVPEELFHAMTDSADGQGRHLVTRIQFIPSSQRTLYHAFDQLRDDEIAIANRIIGGRADPASATRAIAPARGRAVLDALLAYYEYRIAGAGDHVEPSLAAVKDELLRLRLRLPPSTHRLDPPPALPPPTEGHAPARFGIAARHSSNGNAWVLRASAYAQDLFARPSISNKALVALDGQASIGADGHARLDFFDLISIEQHATRDVRIEGEALPSWRLHLGLRRPLPGSGPLAAEVGGGIGRSMSLGGRLLAYVMADGALRSGGRRLAVGPTVGLHGRWAGLRFELAVGSRYQVDDDIWNTDSALELRAPMQRNLELTLAWDRFESEWEVQVGLNAYW